MDITASVSQQKGLSDGKVMRYKCTNYSVHLRKMMKNKKDPVYTSTLLSFCASITLFFSKLFLPPLRSNTLAMDKYPIQSH